jgi:hypothetical protein
MNERGRFRLVSAVALMLAASMSGCSAGTGSTARSGSSVTSPRSARGGGGQVTPSVPAGARPQPAPGAVAADHGYLAGAGHKLLSVHALIGTILGSASGPCLGDLTRRAAAASGPRDLVTVARGLTDPIVAQAVAAEVGGLQTVIARCATGTVPAPAERDRLRAAYALTGRRFVELGVTP